MTDRNDWEDLELDHETPGASSDSASGRSWLPWLLWGLIPLGLFAVWLALSRRADSPPATATPPPVVSESPDLKPTPPEEPGEDEPAIELPPLSESDALFREMAAALSEHPFLAALLGADDLVRKIVVIVANVAEGTSPRRQLGHVRPEKRFSALHTSGRVVLDPEGYRRFDAPAQLFASLDARAVARIYRIFDPLLEEAHAELGLTERRDFDDTLGRAIAALLAVPVVEGPITLRAVSVNYTFEDPTLESLTSAQKHLVRMGPENTRRVQAKLRELAAAMGIEIPGRS